MREDDASPAISSKGKIQGFRQCIVICVSRLGEFEGLALGGYSEVVGKSNTACLCSIHANQEDPEERRFVRKNLSHCEWAVELKFKSATVEQRQHGG